MEQTNDFLGKEKIFRLMLKFSILCVLSLVVGALYNIVDQIFIGNSELGEIGNAATGVVFPIFIIAQASLIRDIVCFVPLICILPIFFGIEGILWAAPIADAIAMAVSAILTVIFFTGLKGTAAEKGFKKSLHNLSQ